MSKNKLLTFEINKDKDEIQIHTNKEGLGELIKYLEKISCITPPTHDHFMTPSWSGMELTEEKQGSDNILINKVTVYLWNGTLQTGMSIDT